MRPSHTSLVAPRPCSRSSPGPGRPPVRIRTAGVSHVLLGATAGRDGDWSGLAPVSAGQSVSGRCFAARTITKAVQPGVRCPRIAEPSAGPPPAGLLPTQSPHLEHEGDTVRPPDAASLSRWPISRLSPRARTAAATALALVAGGLLVSSPAAEADPQPTFTAGKAVARNCFAKPDPKAPGVASRAVEATTTGLVRVRLDGGGDWDVAVFDMATRRAVAASSGFRSSELAEGYVSKGQKLLVQACRYAGTARSVNYGIGFVTVETTPVAGTTQLVEVRTADRAAKRRLQALDLDLTEAATVTSMEAVLHGDADERRLRAAGFTYTVKIPDLRKRVAANRAADATYAAKRAGGSTLPSGRTSYRRLADYQYEMKELAREHHWLARPITLPEKSDDTRTT